MNQSHPWVLIAMPPVGKGSCGWVPWSLGSLGTRPAHSILLPHSPASAARPAPTGVPTAPGAVGAQAGTAWAAHPASSAGASVGSASRCCLVRAGAARTKRPRTANLGPGPRRAHMPPHCGVLSPWVTGAPWMCGPCRQTPCCLPSSMTAMGRCCPCPASSSCA